MSDAGEIAMRELLRQLEVVEGQRDKAIGLLSRANPAPGVDRAFPARWRKEYAALLAEMENQDA